MIKKYIRSFIGLIVCKRFRITYKTIPFVGLRMKVVNQMGGKIICGSNVSFSSDTYLFNGHCPKFCVNVNRIQL